MPSFSLDRSTHINADPAHVHAILSDMGQWATWSPWLITDPNTKVTVSEDRKNYSWLGPRTGVGEMHLSNSKGKDEIFYDLTFLKPFKSSSKVSMKIVPQGDGTKVTWGMEGSLPFFMFFFKKAMMAYIGSDYERGLVMLKYYAETGMVPSKLSYIGVNDHKGGDYVGMRRNASTHEAPAMMEQDFGELMQFAYSNAAADPEQAFSIYEKWDLVNEKATYTAAVPVTSTVEGLPTHWVKGSLPSMKVYTIQHTGPYEFLGNAWATAAMMIRGKEFKPSRKYMPFETYGNSPKDTDPNDLITFINFPLK